MGKIRTVVPESTEWREIDGFPGYWVSNKNHVFNMQTKKLLTTRVNNAGVLSVNLHREKKTFGRSVNALRKRAFKEKN